MHKIVLNRQVELKSSYEWLKNGFRIFREAPLQFIVLSIISYVLSFFVPFIGAFFAPLIIARFAALSSTIESDQKISMNSIFTNLFQNKTLMHLAYINLIFGSLIMLTKHYIINDNEMSLLTDLSAKAIIYLFSVMVFQTFFWISPIICEYNRDVSALDAMILSFKASFYNVAAMLLYGVIITAFTILSIIPLGLGLFILVPVINISSYFIYKSFFVINNKPSF